MMSDKSYKNENMTRAQFELEAIVNALKDERLNRGSSNLYRIHCKPHKYIPTLFVYDIRFEKEKIILGLLDKATKNTLSDVISYSDRNKFSEWIMDNMPAVISKNSVVSKFIDYANNKIFVEADYEIDFMKVYLYV